MEDFGEGKFKIFVNICRTRIFKKIGTQSKPVDKKLTKKSRRKN